jgi:hypothetical protein
MIDKSIGGYFELELNNLNSVFHEKAIGLNTGRNAMEYILKVKAIQKIYIPYFTCDVLLEPLRKLKIPYEFYFINEQLEPIFDFSVLEDKDGFLYTNYFGLKNFYISQLSQVCEQLIVDNAQAFYSKPLNNKPTFYSPRKFFGVADGAYLYCEEILNQVFEKDKSSDRMSHLLIRKDVSAEAGYVDFVINDKKLINKPIQKMSKLTESILSMINYETAAKKRIENYRNLDVTLKSRNKLTLQLDDESVPMVYPYWTKDITLRKRLLKNKIYTATYWPNVKEWCKENSLELQLVNEVVYLPIDQRYGYEEMEIIKKLVLNE